MHRLCRILAMLFAVLYLLALAVFITGTFGLFGVEPDPLSAIYLIPLGLPWSRFIDQAVHELWPWLAAAAPALNLAIIALVCRFLRR